MKHLAQAGVLIMESHKGYEIHRRWAIGHLAEAEDELLTDFPHLANKVRAERLLWRQAWDAEVPYQIPFNQLLTELDALATSDLTVELPEDL